MRAWVAAAWLAVAAGAACPAWGQDRAIPPPGWETDEAIVRQVQARLRAEGWGMVPVDGRWSNMTKAGVASFQERMGLRPTGQLDRETLAALRIQPTRPPGGAAR
jgi:peptidoglycan hydrolase-like protein with peptidoglycan-binding domain